MALIKTIQSYAHRLGFERDWYLIVLGAGIGTITAIGAIGFAGLLDIAREGASELHFSLPLWSLIALPMAGALITGLLIHFFAAEARGHGVPEIIDALYRRAGQVPPRITIIKALTSISTIGSGGSAGAEGPIVQIGSAIGSNMARLLGVSRDQAGTLLGCGAAAGIASVFNAPIAGVFFVLEILLRDFSLRTFTPIVIASVFSAAVTQAILGENEALFAVSESLMDYTFTLAELPGYLILGMVCGLIATAFIKLLYQSEDMAKRLNVHPIVKPIIGAAILGLMGILYVLLVHEQGTRDTLPAFYGNGYDSIRALLNPASYVSADSLSSDFIHIAGFLESGTPSLVETTIGVLTLLLACKLVATCLTLGSGGSGGVFAPSLFLGAVTGSLFGVMLDNLGIIPPGGSPAAYALVGMAAVVSGTTHAPLTAILIILEITRDEYVLLPIMLAAVMSTAIARYLMRDSIYTLKLRRRGLLLGSALDLSILRRITARDVPLVPHVTVRPEDPASKVYELNRQYQVSDVVVVRDDEIYEGIITSADIKTALLEMDALPFLLVEDLVMRTLPTITHDEGLDIVMDKFAKHDVTSLAVVEPDANGNLKVAGLLTRGRLMNKYQQALRES
ncbi:MAG: chloride channel protein [Planctomycetota bacterium]|jgi:CIC family chloride channel protein